MIWFESGLNAGIVPCLAVHLPPAIDDVTGEKLIITGVQLSTVPRLDEIIVAEFDAEIVE